MYYGYHRVSTKEQHLDRGISEIEIYCYNNNIDLDKIYTDKMSGKKFERPRYTVLKEDVLRPGDTLIITELDRLGRNKKSILGELEHFKQNNIRIMILEIPTTLMTFSGMKNEMMDLMLETINNMLIEMYTALAQAEMEKKEKRQAEGIHAMKIRGEWHLYGRKRVMPLDQFREEYQKVLSGEKRPVDIIKEFGLTNSTYYRYKKEIEKN